MTALPHFTAEQIAMAKLYAAATPPDDMALNQHSCHQRPFRVRRAP